MIGPDVEHLEDHSALLEVAPRAGGIITRYAGRADTRTVDYLRPATTEAVAGRVPTDGACFPLVPFSNRIRDGRFTFRGREIQLPANFPPEPHAIHGHGWHAEWDVVERSDRSLTLTYLHEADAWPFPYRAEQRLTLDDGALQVELSVENVGDDPMPAGFGLHPYFVRTPETTVRADVDQVWIPDDALMPDRLVDPPAEWDLSGGIRADEVALDNNFTGWSGRAAVIWPERDARIELRAEGPFRFLVVYSPPGEAFVCAEPATNVIDAFNLEAEGRETGMLVVEPGERVEGVVRFEPTSG